MLGTRGRTAQKHLQRGRRGRQRKTRSDTTLKKKLQDLSFFWRPCGITKLITGHRVNSLFSEPIQLPERYITVETADMSGRYGAARKMMENNLLSNDLLP